MSQTLPPIPVNPAPGQSPASPGSPGSPGSPVTPEPANDEPVIIDVPPEDTSA